MKQQYTFQPGASARSVSIPNGAMVRSVQIDNLSASWLFVPSEGTFIPPLTIGYILNLSWAAISVSVLSQTGPGGQPVNSNGSAWTLTLNTDHDTASNGSQYSVGVGTGKLYANDFVGFGMIPPIAAKVAPPAGWTTYSSILIRNNATAAEYLGVSSNADGSFIPQLQFGLAPGESIVLDFSGDVYLNATNTLNAAVLVIP